MPGFSRPAWRRHAIGPQAKLPDPSSGTSDRPEWSQQAVREFTRSAPTTDESGHPRDIASLRKKEVSRVAKHAISLAKDLDKSVTAARTIAKKKLRTALEIGCEPITCTPTSVEYNYSEGESNFFSRDELA